MLQLFGQTVDDVLDWEQFSVPGAGSHFRYRKITPGNLFPHFFCYVSSVPLVTGVEYTIFVTA